MKIASEIPSTEFGPVTTVVCIIITNKVDVELWNEKRSCREKGDGGYSLAWPVHSSHNDRKMDDFSRAKLDSQPHHRQSVNSATMVCPIPKNPLETIVCTATRANINSALVLLRTYNTGNNNLQPVGL